VLHQRERARRERGGARDTAAQRGHGPAAQAPLPKYPPARDRHLVMDSTASWTVGGNPESSLELTTPVETPAIPG